jgi:hypothetical protein
MEPLCKTDAKCNTVLVQIKDCLKQKIGYKSLVFALAGLLGVSSPFILYAMKSYADEKKSNAGVKEQVARIETHYEHIQKQLEKVEEQIISPDKLKQILREVIQDAKEISTSSP